MWCSLIIGAAIGCLITLTAAVVVQKARDKQCNAGNHKPVAFEDGAECYYCGEDIK